MTAVVLYAAMALGGDADPSELRVRFVVQVPAIHYGADLYLASNANNWNPSDSRWKFRPGSASQPGRFILEMPAAAIPGTGLEYKVTKGDWATVEVDFDRREIPNRVLLLPQRIPDSGIIEVALTIPAFADERTHTERHSTVVGSLEIFDFTSRSLGNTRKIRVWLPEHYADHPDRSFPVLYMHDGQNCFDESTSAFGSEWRIDESMTELIRLGEIPPMIVVGIDNAGADRAYEYNSPRAVFGNRQPYGDRYVAMLIDELMPEIATRYRVLSGPENTSIGGSSFGGNITILAAMLRPGTFGRLLIESPAVPVVGPQFLADIQSYGARNRWTPEIEGFNGGVFIAMGTRETANEVYNLRLVKLMEELAPCFREERLQVLIEQDAIHNELAWAKRFPTAARFLFGSGSDESEK